MEQAKIWLIFLGFIALLIGFALAVVLIAVGWMLGIRDYYEKNHFLSAGIALIIPIYGIFNGFMFALKRRCGLECCSNYEVFQVFSECISLEIAERKKTLSL